MRSHLNCHISASLRLVTNDRRLVCIDDGTLVAGQIDRGSAVFVSDFHRIIVEACFGPLPSQYEIVRPHSTQLHVRHFRRDSFANQYFIDSDAKRSSGRWSVDVGAHFKAHFATKWELVACDLCLVWMDDSATGARPHHDRSSKPGIVVASYDLH